MPDSAGLATNTIFPLATPIRTSPGTSNAATAAHHPPRQLGDTGEVVEKAYESSDMNILQKLFESTSFERLTTKLITQKIEEKGYSLTDEQLAAIREQVGNSDEDRLTIELPDDIDLQISIEEDDITRALDEYAENLSEEMPRAVQQASEVVLADLRARAPEMLKEHEEFKNDFEKRLWHRWGKALELLKMFIVIATEAGEDFNGEFRALAAQEGDFKFDVLTRLHARSCQIANEVLTLLRSGYADGAHARWRSMHEVAVVGFFVSKFDQDVAERYLLHDVVESYRAALQYKCHSSRLGYEPLTNQELSTLQSSRQRLIDRFGDSYKNNYGWAAYALGKDNPTFSDIEEAIGLGHWRPHYKLASHNVHANPKGVSFKLGLYPSDQQLLLAGASDTGFADPGHSTTISLLQITTSLLTLKPNIDRLSVCQILSTLAEEIGNVFLSIQKAREEASQP
jgi:hypothetical protein